MHAVCTIMDCPIDEHPRECIPFLFMVSLVGTIPTFFPEIVLYLPDTIFGPG